MPGNSHGEPARPLNNASDGTTLTAPAAALDTQPRHRRRAATTTKTTNPGQAQMKVQNTPTTKADETNSGPDVAEPSPVATAQPYISSTVTSAATATAAP